MTGTERDPPHADAAPGYEGTLVFNYRLTRKLGEGGFGAVYLAEHVDLGRRAACKILHPLFARDPGQVERFFREARAVCDIGHRAIVAIENFGRLPGGEPFYLMEYFPGQPLGELAAARRLTPAQLVAIFDPIADALTAAHAKGIVHRDLKPDNIMVRADGDRIVDVRLLDFGIAKLLDGIDGVASMSGLPMGTPAYMAPEQALDSKAVDERADVYALGATVFAAMAGRPPFVGASVPAILIEAQTQPAPPLRAFRGDVPEDLDAAVARCLEKSPAARPPSIAAAWGDLRAAILYGSRGRALVGTADTLPPEAAAALASTAAGAPTTLAPGATATPPPASLALDATATPPPPSLALDATATPTPSGAHAAATAPARRPPPVALLIGAGVAAAAVVVTVIVMVAGGSGDAGRASPPAAADSTAKATDRDAPGTVASATPVPEAAPPPPDAEVPPPDAAPPDAAPPPPDAAPRSTPRPRPDAGASRGDCSEASFVRVYKQPSPTDDEIRAALRRLKACEGALAPATYRRLQQALIAKQP